MKIKVPSGKYILAVSGGVDSMVLLDLLSKLPEVELIIAHFDHGIRSDSAEDEALVERAADSYDLEFETRRGNLGAGASEDEARQARYVFLRDLQKKYRAAKIITAHHQDDLIETALINLIRGTGRQGLSSISSNPGILRPLLGVPKEEIIKYAKVHDLKWREDSSNTETDYLRNRLRHKVLSTMDDEKRQAVLKNLSKAATLNLEIDKNIATLSQLVGEQEINRSVFSALPVAVGNEILVHQLRSHGIHDFDSKTINRLNMAIRTARVDSTHPIKRQSSLKIGLRTATWLTS